MPWISVQKVMGSILFPVPKRHDSFGEMCCGKNPQTQPTNANKVINEYETIIPYYEQLLYIY